MCNPDQCWTCSSHPAKIKLDFLDIFIGIFSVDEERENDKLWPTIKDGDP